MITIGITQFLNIDRLTDFGLFLGDNEGNEVLLPNKYVPIYARKKNGVVTIYFDEMKKNDLFTLEDMTNHLWR